MRILITGATGLIGNELGLELVRHGHSLVVISRDPKKARVNCPFPCTSITWGEIAQVKGEIDGIINLAGDGIADGRWTEKKKKSIVESRLTSTAKVVQFAKEHSSVKFIISASAVGFYGNRAQEVLTEQSAPGTGFLSEVCQKWEASLFNATLPSRVRTVAIRIGIVLSRQGGALEKMVPLFEKGIGGAIGFQKSWMSWIHLQDLVRMFVWSVEEQSVRGIYNGVSGYPSTNFEFANALAEAVGSSSKLPAPALALKLALGEMSEVVLQSQKIEQPRAVAEGFHIQGTDLKTVLADLFPNGKSHESLLLQKQWVNKTPAEIFPFFSDAKNLERLTPAFLKFNVLSISSPEIKSGTEIRYRLNIHGFPASWLTEIKEWNPPHRFIDNQVKGPYSLWHHTHTFEPLAGGTLMTDSVRFRLPLGWLGRVGGGSLVRHDVTEIFNFRRQVIAELF